MYKAIHPWMEKKLIERNKMDSILSKGILLTVATTFVFTGLNKIGEDILIGGGLMLLGAGIFILREYLKKRGWEIGNK